MVAIVGGSLAALQLFYETFGIIRPLEELINCCLWILRFSVIMLPLHALFGVDLDCYGGVNRAVTIRFPRFSYLFKRQATFRRKAAAVLLSVSSTIFVLSVIYGGLKRTNDASPTFHVNVLSDHFAIIKKTPTGEIRKLRSVKVIVS